MKLDDLVKPHIEAYEALFKKNIFKKIVEKTRPLLLDDFRLEIDDFRIEPPSILFENTNRRLYPKECRLTNESYKGMIFIKCSLYEGDDLIKSEVKEVYGFPVMVKSMFCNLKGVKDMTKYGEDEKEAGGFFVINGLDKLVRFHIMPKRNYPFALIRNQQNKIYSDKIISIRSVGEDELGHMNFLLYSNDGNVYLKFFHRMNEFHVPLVVVLKALVNTTDSEIYTLLDNDPYLTTALRKAGELNVFSRGECLEYLGSHFKHVLGGIPSLEAGQIILDDVIVPHLEEYHDKFNFLLMSLKKLYSFVRSEIVQDDPDSPSSHELLTETQLFANVFKDRIEEFKRNFRGVYYKHIKAEADKKRKAEQEEVEIEYMVKKEKILFTFKIADFKTFARGFHTFLSSGNVTHNNSSDLMQNAGFVLIAERINFYRYISHFRSVNRGTFFQQVRTTTVRKLRPESWGFLCPIHTPDGTPCGLLTHLTTGVELVSIPDAFDTAVFFEWGVVPVIRGSVGGVPLFYDGKLMGYTLSPRLLVEKLREYRRRNSLRIEIVFNDQDRQFRFVSVHNGIGRFTRPVLHTPSGVVEWIGIMEQVFLNINLKDKNSFSIGNTKESFEYEEIDNQNLFSLVASLTPFSEYNQSPRSMYQCQMAKQSMGVPAHNLSIRTDTKLYTINYTQHPIVRNINYKVLEDYPLGINCIVAVLAYTAYDMEDAMVINKGSMERGLFCGYVYKTDKIELPRDAFFSYLPNIGHKLNKNDVLYTYTDLSGKEYVVKTGNYEGYVVDAVDIFRNEFNVCANIKFRIIRNPNIGDKFCSRHGQKGVCSMHWPTIDMPFTEGGIVPDIIINPHAFPSRMTIGMLIESMAGKAGACTGEYQDATAFEKNSYIERNGKMEDASTFDKKKQSIGEDLVRNGFNYFGNESMYSGVNGSEFRTDIFIGVVFYQRLRHMVNDKFQVRASGAVISTTRQPVGGRKKLGGVRFGEMERDALIGHGTSYLLNDRLLKCSDHHVFTYCCSCKSILFTERNKCACGGKEFTTVELPFVFKYLCSELMAMNIKVELDMRHPA